MQYISCRLCNFRWNGNLVKVGLPVLLGKGGRGGIAPLTVAELPEILDYLRSKEQHFQSVTVVSGSSFTIDLYDKIRHDRPLPDLIDLDSNLFCFESDNNVGTNFKAGLVATVY
jgi:hypothetical protein